MSVKRTAETMTPTGGGHDFAVGITVLSGGVTGVTGEVAVFGGGFEPDSVAELVRNKPPSLVHEPDEPFTSSTSSA